MRRLLPILLVLLLAPAAGAARAPAPVSIFYYPWWGTLARDGSYQHWQQDWHLPPADIASDYYPSRGVYSSSDPRVVDAQMREIAAAGVREVVSSWWGWGSIEDQRLPLVIQSAHAHGLGVAVQLEPYERISAPYIDRTAATVAADLGHLRDLGITRIYVYQPFDGISDADWTAMIAAAPDLQLLAQTTNPARAAADGFKGVYTYDVVSYGSSTFDGLCRRARALHLLCAPSVGPGFAADRATGDTVVKARRDGRTYDEMWRAAIAAHPDRVTITSYNEWHEGTQIEPARTPPARTLAMSPTLHFSYETYDGAYGAHGPPASRAYLERTAYWVARYAGR